MLPMLGLFAELYRGRETTTRDAYALVEPLVDRLYPRTFTYRRDGHADEEHPLFGDLVDAVRHAIDTEADARSSGDGSPLGSFDGRNYFPGTHARRHARTRHGAGSLSSVQSRTSLRLPSLLSRRGSSKRRLTSESPATIKARDSDSGTNSGTGDLSRTSRKLVNFRTLTWQSSQGESKEDSGPPTF
jgi:hypothetical protein